MLFGGSAEKQAMRGALSASAIADPIDGALALLDRCNQTQLALHYNSKPCHNTRAFLAHLAQKRGMLKAGGIPDMDKAARQILQGEIYIIHPLPFLHPFSGMNFEVEHAKKNRGVYM